MTKNEMINEFFHEVEVETNINTAGRRTNIRTL